MAEKNDDIKQLFTHLGLNPSDYQELRNADRVPERKPDTVDSPRRWSLLDSMAAQPAAEPAVTKGPSSVEVRVATPPLVEPAPAPAPVARELSRAELERESLQSFFEAVKEPLPSASLDIPQDAPSIPVTAELRATGDLAAELRKVPEADAARIADLVRSRWPAESAKEPPREAVVARIDPASLQDSLIQLQAAAESPAADARLKLRFGEVARPAAVAGAAESLADVFRRLAAAGHRP
jgi:hypothetical protein